MNEKNKLEHCGDHTALYCQAVIGWKVLIRESRLFMFSIEIKGKTPSHYQVRRQKSHSSFGEVGCTPEI